MNGGNLNLILSALKPHSRSVRDLQRATTSSGPRPFKLMTKGGSIHGAHQLLADDFYEIHAVKG